ncbi:MAG: hypothetical protein ACR2QF_07915 [Geminicoccaceae bacterium]
MKRLSDQVGTATDAASGIWQANGDVLAGYDAAPTVAIHPAASGQRSFPVRVDRRGLISL